MKKIMSAMLVCSMLATMMLTGCGKDKDEFSVIKGDNSVDDSSSMVDDSSTADDSSTDDSSETDDSSTADDSSTDDSSETDDSSTADDSSEIDDSSTADDSKTDDSSETDDSSTADDSSSIDDSKTDDSSKAEVKEPTTTKEPTTKPSTTTTKEPAKNVFISNTYQTGNNCLVMSPAKVWYENGSLIAQMYIYNGYPTTAYDINNVEIKFDNGNQVIAYASFGYLDGAVIAPSSYILWTFSFGSDCVITQNADLNYLHTQTSSRNRY